MMEMDAQQSAARAWFESLRDRICAAFETIEREAGSDAAFSYTPWNRDDDPEGAGGGGVQGKMKGKVFEKVGVNVSTVAGDFAPEFAATIHGAADNPGFFATGISLVAHMANPHVPAIHLNTRFLVTGKRWFGGGADLNPPIPYAEDTAAFHAAMESACAQSPAGDFPRFKQWANDYFWIPHRKLHRGVGGIFYDHLECNDAVTFDDNFALSRALGEAFLDIYPSLVRKRRDMPWSDADKARQLVWRGLYAEFNLIHDRGTLFGLKTGGNIDAILMSLPPVAAWD
jgi:coproporphyrinogen III oxidase